MFSGLLSPLLNPCVSEKLFSAIPFEHQLFDRLREDYPLSFDSWVDKNILAGNKAWLTRSMGGRLTGFMKIRFAKGPVKETVPYIACDAIKISSFEALNPRSLEMLLSIAFAKMRQNGAACVFVSFMPDHAYFAEMFMKNGFYLGGHKNREDVWIWQYGWLHADYRVFRVCGMPQTA